MTTWYRAHTKGDAQGVFSGDGGLFVQGRWSELGKRVIYCSESIALATMEWLSHNGLSVSGFSYYRYSIEIPDSMVMSYGVKQLPKDWNATPSTDSTRDFANAHLFSLKTVLAIAVPSVLVPEEKNLIINPLHPDFAKVAGSIVSLGRFVAPVR